LLRDRTTAANSTLFRGQRCLPPWRRSHVARNPRLRRRARMTRSSRRRALVRAALPDPQPPRRPQPPGSMSTETSKQARGFQQARPGESRFADAVGKMPIANRLVPRPCPGSASKSTSSASNRPRRRYVRKRRVASSASRLRPIRGIDLDEQQLTGDRRRAPSENVAPNTPGPPIVRRPSCLRRRSTRDDPLDLHCDAKTRKFLPENGPPGTETPRLSSVSRVRRGKRTSAADNPFYSGQGSPTAFQLPARRASCPALRARRDPGHKAEIITLAIVRARSAVTGNVPFFERVARKLSFPAIRARSRELADTARGDDECPR